MDGFDTIKQLLILFIVSICVRIQHTHTFLDVNKKIMCNFKYIIFWINIYVRQLQCGFKRGNGIPLYSVYYAQLLIMRYCTFDFQLISNHT